MQSRVLHALVNLFLKLLLIYVEGRILQLLLIWQQLLIRTDNLDGLLQMNVFDPLGQYVCDELIQRHTHLKLLIHGFVHL